MTSLQDDGRAEWKRFNDEIFCLHAALDVPPTDLVDELAKAGVELVVDARRDLNGEASPMKVGCDNAGLYYVPSADTRDLSDRVVSRYADLALRHKTCLVVNESADELLEAIAARRPLRTVPLEGA